MTQPGTILTLDIEKPAAGGRMLARHNGQIVLVWGAIPGERVRARVERAAKGVIYGETVELLSTSADRRDAPTDWRCGGSVLSHVAYPRQLGLKGEIIADAFGRIGRVPLASVPTVVASPERGYRMRARLHVRDGHVGFFREGSHQLCDPAGTAQLLPETNAWIADIERRLIAQQLMGVVSLDLAENMAGDQRACHLDLAEGENPQRYEILVPSNRLTGMSMRMGESQKVHCPGPQPTVADVLHARRGDPGSAFRLRRDVRAFFQGNRYLLEWLTQHVVDLVPDRPLIDLYAGVGLFGLAVASTGGQPVTLVEGDQASEADLTENAAPFGPRVAVECRSVEGFLRELSKRRGTLAMDCSVIVDPPRTGLSEEARRSITTLGPSRVVYVSCDVATLARDTRTLLDGGYEIEGLTGVDLFPNTAHVETVVSFVRVHGT